MVCSGGFPVILTSEVIVVFKHFQRTFHQLLVLWMCLMRQCTSEESTIIAEEEIQSNQTVVVSTDDDNSSKVLSRRKRYIVFPEGASFSVIWMGLYLMGILLCNHSITGRCLYDNRYVWKSQLSNVQLGFELGHCVQFTQPDNKF